MQTLYLCYKIGNYQISVEGKLKQRYINIKAEKGNNKLLINNLNYILSNVIEPAIPDWQNKQDIVNGDSITGNKAQLKKIIRILWNLRNDPHFLNALNEDFAF